MFTLKIDQTTQQHHHHHHQTNPIRTHKRRQNMTKWYEEELCTRENYNQISTFIYMDVILYSLRDDNLLVHWMPL